MDRKYDGHDTDAGRQNYDQLGPAEEKSGEASEAFGEVVIVAASSRIGRAEFRITESANQGQKPPKAHTANPDHGLGTLPKINRDASKIVVPITMPTMMLAASHAPSFAAVGSSTGRFIVSPGCGAMLAKVRCKHCERRLPI